VQVEEIIHSRMTDVTHLKKSMDANDFAVETGIDVALWKPARNVKHSRRPSRGPQLDDVQDGALAGTTLLYKDLKEVVVRSEGAVDLEFWPHVWEHVTLRVKCATSVERDELLTKVREHSLGKPWEHEYDSSVFSAFVRFKRALTAENSIVEKFLAFPELFISVCLMSTLSLVDVKDIRNEGRWGLCFLGGMVWLALQSYFLLGACDCIHYHMPFISTSFLGVTVCAVGTSFPNAIASVILARQGQSAAAIANALGSNVQNVFLAMALPWAFYSATSLSFGAIAQDVAGIDEGVLWMMGTLALLIVVALWPPTFGLQKSHGVLFIVVYAAYLLDASAETLGL
jgi:Ca2+/Na+ antiporter